MRDKRVSTHLLLVARAFGAKKAFYTGTQDDSIEESIKKIVKDWGGDFTVEYADSWKTVLRCWEGKVVHLTMYGIPVQDAVDEIRSDTSHKLVIVGGAKVPGEVYSAVNWNVSVTNQPHSEVSALAIFLHELFEGAELKLGFPDARLKIVPQTKGKRFEGKREQV